MLWHGHEPGEVAKLFLLQECFGVGMKTSREEFKTLRFYSTNETRCGV